MHLTREELDRLNMNAKRIIERQKAQERYEKRIASNSKPKRSAIIVSFPKK